MAKKRGGSPLGNAPGTQEAMMSAAIANVESLSNQLSVELEKTGQDPVNVLSEKFGLKAIGYVSNWILASGASASFTEISLSYDQVKNDTFVTFDVNGREQSLLTRESLQDLDSMEYQQFYPAVGREVDGKIDILDGSRRRAWFLLQKGKIESFRILVTKDLLSAKDAKYLAKQLQTAKEHNLREKGLQCLAIQETNEGITQEKIAELVGLSQAGVSKALKAASIDSELVRLFPIANDLTHQDYVLLDKVMRSFSEPSLLSLFINKLAEKIVNIQAEYSAKDTKDAIVAIIKSELKIVEANKTSSILVTPLAEFSSPGVYARKRVNGRNFAYEFGRLSKNVQNDLDEAIANVLAKHVV